MANARDDPVTASSWGRSWLSSIKLMWNVYCSKHLDLCWFECFKLVLRNQNKTLSSLHAVSQVLMLNQVSPPPLFDCWLIVTFASSGTNFSHRASPDTFPSWGIVLSDWYQIIYLISLSSFCISRLQLPRLNLSILPHFMTGGCDVRPVAGGRLGVWPHLVPWHLVRLKREEISWWSQMLSPRHRPQACQTEL